MVSELLYRMERIFMHTWHFIRMSKKSSSGSFLSFVIKCWSTDWLLFFVRRSPGKLLKLALWSSRRRLCELARRSKNSSVLGDTTETDGAMNRRKRKNPPKCYRNAETYVSVHSSSLPCTPVLVQRLWIAVAFPGSEGRMNPEYFNYFTWGLVRFVSVFLHPLLPRGGVGL